MKTNSIFRFTLFILITSLLHSCGQKASTDSSITNNSASLSDPTTAEPGTDTGGGPNQPNPPPTINTDLNRAPEIRGVTGAPPSPAVKQYQLGDAVVSQNFVNALKAASLAPSIPAAAGRSKATATGVTLWPNGLVPVYFDVEMGLAEYQISNLKSNIYMACYRWLSVAKVQCIELSDLTKATGPYLTVTLAHAPQGFSSGKALCPDSALSCATLGVQEGFGKNYIAVDFRALSNAWDMTRQVGVVLGLSYEHQRPGRNNYLQIKAGFNSSLPENAQYQVVPNLPAVNNDYDFASIMHNPTVNLRDPDFLNGKTVLAFKTSSLFENNYMLHRASQNYPKGTLGNKVNLPAYPSIQDAQNLVALYGAPTGKNSPCILNNPKQTVPHGAQIGVYSTQAPSETTAYCADEPRVCKDGLFVGNANASMGFKTCPIRCIIASERIVYGESKIIYTIQSGTTSQCAASRKEVFCDMTNLGDDKATVGFSSCTTNGN